MKKIPLRLSVNSLAILLFWGSFIWGGVLTLQLINLMSPKQINYVQKTDTSCISEVIKSQEEGSAYACLNKDGKIYRSDVPCK